MSFLIGKKAPDFKATAIMGDNSANENFILSEFLSGKKGIVFFYPLNFTFVCPSEIIAFDKKLEEFKKRNTEVVGVSIDSHFSHIAYKNTSIDNGGIGKIKYPLVSDITNLSYYIFHCLARARIAFLESQRLACTKKRNANVVLFVPRKCISGEHLKHLSCSTHFIQLKYVTSTVA